MIGYVYDDGGRMDSGRRGHTGDCLTRAISIVSGDPYDYVYKCVSETMNRYGYGKSGNVYYTRSKSNNTKKTRRRPGIGTVQLKILEEYGFKKMKLDSVKPTYTEAYEIYGNCIVTTTKHFAAIVDGNLSDTFDGRQYLWKDCFGMDTMMERKAISVFVLYRS